MMERASLAALLDDDREMVLAGLAGDRTLSAAQTALEKAVDRVMYRFVERCDDPELRDCGQYLLQAMKNTLPLVDAVGEARSWKKQAPPPARAGLRLRPLALAALLAGLALVLASVLAVLIAGHTGGALAFVRVLLPVVLGCAGLFWAGVLAAKPKRQRADAEDPAAVRTEFLVDAEKAWHCLRGAMLQADGLLQRAGEEIDARRQREADSAEEGAASSPALELFAELLESAYASKDESARESASAIRFYLHSAQVDVEDYQPGRESWFEFLPAPGTGTIRPALVSGGKVLKKGLASR